MSILQRHNGQFIALSLAVGCAMFITYSVFGYDRGEEDEGRVIVIAGLCALVTTWVFWKLLVARGTRILILRGATAGALSGLFAIPLFLFAGAFVQASSGCPDVSCVFDEILQPDYISELAIGSAIFSIFGFVIVGPLSVSVGVLGGILAVIASGARKPASGHPEAHNGPQEANRDVTPDEQIEGAATREKAPIN